MTSKTTAIVKNAIFKGVLFIPTWRTKKKPSKKVAAAFVAEMGNYGFAVDPVSVEKVRADYLQVLLEAAKEAAGSDVPAPMFPGFPEANILASDIEIIYSQLVGYVADLIQVITGENLRETLSFGRNIPRNSHFLNVSELKVLRVEDETEMAKRAAMTLCGRSMSASDKVFVENVISSGFPVFAHLSEGDITSREIAAWVRCMQLQHDFECEDLLPTPAVKDAIRLAAILSGGDESLGKKVHFTLSAKNRKVVMDLFNRAIRETGKENALEQMADSAAEFKSLFKVLHPSKSDDSLGVISAFFDGDVKTFNSKLELAYRSEDIVEVLALLKKKPGLFARNLNRVVSLAETIGAPIAPIQVAFASVAKDIPVQVLWTMKNFFEGRNDEKSYFFPKKKSANPFSKENAFVSLDSSVESSIMVSIDNAIRQHYAAEESLLGKTVYLSPEMSGFVVPSANRSLSRALKAVGRGSRMAIAKDANCIRSFVYWKGNGIDLDLSVMFLDEKFGLLGRVAYYCQRVSLSDFGVADSYARDYVAVHSGDITSAPYGASEFVDIDVAKAKQIPNCRYIAVVVNSYSGDEFGALPAAFCGAMERSEMDNEGEVYEPSSVRFKSDLCGDGRQCIPMVIDIVENQFIWTDISSNGEFRSCGNVDSNKGSLSNAVAAVINKRRTNLYDLFATACAARNATFVSAPRWNEVDSDGNVVEKSADLIFSVDEGVTPYDFEKISGEWL